MQRNRTLKTGPSSKPPYPILNTSTSNRPPTKTLPKFTSTSNLRFAPPSHERADADPDWEYDDLPPTPPPLAEETSNLALASARIALKSRKLQLHAEYGYDWARIPQVKLRKAEEEYRERVARIEEGVRAEEDMRAKERRRETHTYDELLDAQDEAERWKGRFFRVIAVLGVGVAVVGLLVLKTSMDERAFRADQEARMDNENRWTLLV